MQTDMLSLSRTRRPRFASRLVPGLLLFAACGGELAGGAPGGADPDRGSQPLYVDTNGLWSGGVMPVCWESTPAADEWKRNAVRAALDATWAREANLRFTGWGRCNWYLSTNPQVRIRVADERPNTLGLGTIVGRQYGGMTLNFTFQNWDTGCQSNLEACIKSIAVHEFGHALGFAHEQNRPDTPPTCDERSGSNGNRTIGAWDLSSVMNYCNPSGNNGLLSQGDIIGVQTIYGRRRASTIGAYNRCLVPTIVNGQTTMRPCGVSAVGIGYAGPTMKSTLTNPASGSPQCLAVQSPDAPTVLRDCQGTTPAQQFYAKDAMLRGLGGQCLTTLGTTAYNLVIMRACTGAATQKFTQTAAGELRTPAGLCLSTFNGGSADGTMLTIAPCNSGASQRFAARPANSGLSGIAGGCIDVGTTIVGDGPLVTLRTCQQGLNQKWGFVGQLKNAGGQCLFGGGAIVYDGDPTGLISCDVVAPATTWETFL